MNPNEVIGGLMTGKLELSIGCGQSRQLKGLQQRVNTEAGTTRKTIKVSGKLWEGSDKVKALTIHFTQLKRTFALATTPWVEGIRVFKSTRIEEIYSLSNELIATIKPMVDDIVNNYDTERQDAYTEMGAEGRMDHYPASGEEFRNGIIQNFRVDTLGSSNAIIQVVGGALGVHLAREHEAELRETLGKSQQEVADRVVGILTRFMDVCDPGKDRTRVTDSLFDDFKQLTATLPDLLLFPNPSLVAFNERIKMEMGNVSQEELSKDKHARAAVHAQAKDLIAAFSAIPMV